MKPWLPALVFIAGLTISYGQPVTAIESLGLTDSQLTTVFEKRHLLLTSHSGGKKKKKKVKEGGFAILKMAGDTTEMEVFMEAFLTDTVIVSVWAPQLKGEEIELQFAGLRLIPLKEIGTIEYNVRHEGGVFWSSFVMVITGLNFAVLPVLMPLILGTTEEVYTQPQFPYIVVGGVILFFTGMKLQRMLNPVVYNLGTDWRYEVVKK
jgi:hypothetical protein